MKHSLSLVAAPLLVIGVLAAPIGGGAGDQNKTRALTQAYNESGQQLFKQFAARPGNIVFSPYSIGTAMAMALAGARGDTETEMVKVLKHRLGRTEIDTANADLLAILSGYDRSGGPTAKLRSANALMLTKEGDRISSEYAALLKDKYAAEVFQGAQLEDINGWVKRKTEGKIEKIIDQLDPDSAAVLLNAVYFKARWASVFDKRLTKDAPFLLTASNKVKVPMMQQMGSFALVKRQGYRAIRLPYQVRALGMVIALPDEVEGLREVAGRLDARELTEVLTALRGRIANPIVELAVPRFKAEFKVELKSSFQQAGMTKAFSDEEADFSGMTRPGSRLVIGRVVHRAVIEVAEESTEAAAATAVEAVPAKARIVPEPFRVDRPFLFYIVDDSSGAILFQGRIADPSKPAKSS